jgi:ribosome-binding ATPase YchF (GTP1/OBG family)
LLEIGNWHQAKNLGKVRLEGKDYIIQEGDVVEFKM